MFSKVLLYPSQKVHFSVENHHICVTERKGDFEPVVACGLSKIEAEELAPSRTEVWLLLTELASKCLRYARKIDGSWWWTRIYKKAARQNALRLNELIQRKMAEMQERFCSNPDCLPHRLDYLRACHSFKVVYDKDFPAWVKSCHLALNKFNELAAVDPVYSVEGMEACKKTVLEITHRLKDKSEGSPNNFLSLDALPLVKTILEASAKTKDELFISLIAESLRALEFNPHFSFLVSKNCSQLWDNTLLLAYCKSSQVHFSAWEAALDEKLTFLKEVIDGKYDSPLIRDCLHIALDETELSISIDFLKKNRAGEYGFNLPQNRPERILSSLIVLSHSKFDKFEKFHPGDLIAGLIPEEYRQLAESPCWHTCLKNTKIAGFLSDYLLAALIKSNSKKEAWMKPILPFLKLLPYSQPAQVNEELAKFFRVFDISELEEILQPENQVLEIYKEMIKESIYRKHLEAIRQGNWNSYQAMLKSDPGALQNIPVLQKALARLEEGMEVTPEIFEALKTAAKNKWNGINKFECKQFHLVFSLDAFHNLIFFKAGADEIEKRFLNMIYGRMICDEHNLNLLVVPGAKRVKFEQDGIEHRFIMVRKLAIQHKDSMQEFLYKSAAHSIREAIRQLAIFISKTGLDDVVWRNVPILDENSDSNGNRRIAILDFDDMGNAEGGIYGSSYWRRGLVRCVAEQHIGMVMQEAEKYGVKALYLDTAQVAARRRAELADDMRLENFYLVKNIRSGKEPISGVFGTPLDPCMRVIVDKINRRFAKSTLDESLKGRRYVRVNTNKRKYTSCGDRSDYEECLNILIENKIVFKIVLSNGHGIHLQA